MNVLNQVIKENYSLYNGDSCEIMTTIPDNSIHYSIFSPPFADLYVYSNSERDMGNCKRIPHFYQPLIFLVTKYSIKMMTARPA